ncbi:MAG: DegT/DnrJ/EryC1/StrS family aminotransferase [Candidatus Altimarinota bacterium]
MIHTSLSPNTERDDLWLAFKSLVLPWNWMKWKTGDDVPELEHAFKKYLGVKNAFAFQRGRDALNLLLKALDINNGDEVILQAYTCIVVPNAIQYNGAVPVYVDIEENGYNIDPDLIEERITHHTKAIIVQHTFGEPADLEKIQKICKKHDLYLIEDCAHALSAKYKGKKVGTFGDAAIWSFGRDKIISSVWGGMITTDDEELARKIQTLHSELPSPTLLQIKQALCHPLLFALIKPFYRFKLGKAALVFVQKIQLIPRVIFPREKRGMKPKFFPQKMSNILARLALHQLKKLQRFHQHRLKLAKLYSEAFQNSKFKIQNSNPHSAWLRYTIRTPDAGKILKRAAGKGIYLGDWYRTVLAPEGCPSEYFQYPLGSCPRAEKAAEETINLPTHVQMREEEVEGVVKLLS